MFFASHVQDEYIPRGTATEPLIMITQNLRAQLLYINTKERGLFCMTILKDL